MEFKPGDIGFVHNGALISKIISWCMGSPWSHTFMIIGEFEGKILVVETSDYQVNINCLDRYMDGRPIAIYRCKSLTEEQRSQIRSRCYDILGWIYGYLQLVSLGIRRLLKKFGIIINNFIHIGIVCCAVPIYLYQGQDTVLKAIDPKSVDTEDLYEIVSKNFELVHTTVEGLK